MCSTFDYTFYQFPQKTEGNTMVNLITLHACPVHTIHILSPDSEKSVRLIITFHFEVSGEQLHTSISTWTCKFTLRILPIYKVWPQTYLPIYLHLHMIQFKHVWGPTILLGLSVWCCHGNPCTLSNSFMFVI
jgi:hypothetical protein